MASTQHNDNLVGSTGKPLQVISWKEKIAKEKEWFKQSANFYISTSRFGATTTSRFGDRDVRVLYDVYNSKFPASWFKSHTDPLSAKNPAHKAFPAKIRPVNFLRTNLDLLMAEYPRRPFIYQVNNLSDDAYSDFQTELNATLEKNLTAHFELKVKQQLMAEGLMTPEGEPADEEAMKQIQDRLDNLELPDKVRETFQASYKDKLAIKGQKAIRREMKTSFVKQTLNKCFKHWLIAGETCSFKTVEFGALKYKAISPIMLDYDKSPEEDFIEDGEWCVYHEYLTVSDVVDMYYEELTKENVHMLETTAIFQSPTHLYDHLSSSMDINKGNKLKIFHVVWKGKKKIGLLTRLNPETGETEDLEVDEDYVVDKETEIVEWKWVNEVYEATKLTSDLYVRLRPFPFQRNVMNNMSKTKLPYNGRKYSDMHSQNISLMEIGMPSQIMYIIVTYALERTIAKSKGKIVLLDQNVIPKSDGWDEEKFFYYTEALGYGLINRNQLGVDKSYNQYQVLDLTLFDSIKQLIDLQQHFKQEWDDLIGINRQRKGQTYASDLVGVNERATFQSTVITDMIFNLFEEFTERELQGFLDLSKFLAIDGVKKLWNDSEVTNELIEIDPVEYCNADLGIFVESSSESIITKNKLEGLIQPLAQNGTKASTLFSILRSQNVAEMEMKLKHLEDLEEQAAQASAQSQQEHERSMEEIQMRHKEYDNLLKKDFMNEEYDRKAELAYITGEFNTFSFKDGDSNANGVPDALEVQKHNLEREKLYEEVRAKNQERQDKIKSEVESNKLKREEIASKERIAKKKTVGKK
jgi:hypothetical protein